jgi:hypothetical protein
MTVLLIALIVVGALLVLGGVLLKPLWRVAIAPFYRQPAAQEPSKLGWGVRSVVMILAGVVVIVAGISLLGNTSQSAPTPSEVESQSCSALVDEVGSPSTSDGADEAIREAANQAGYDVERDESSSESVAETPGGDTTITVTMTTWTVVGAGDTVAVFTWTASDSVPGRFTAEKCG